MAQGRNGRMSATAEFYWFRNGVLQARTRDHSVAELAAQLNPQEPPDPADRHRLVRALGSVPASRAELGPLLRDVRPGDAFLLCSDGVWGIVSDAELASCLCAAAAPEMWNAAIVRQLQIRVEENGLAGHDNFSLIAAMVVA